MVKVKEFIKDEMLYFADPFIKNPTVSVILPTYCRGDNGLLKRAIDSVLSQTFQNFELIIVDDGSVDGTENLVKSYLSQDNRILYIRNKINSGLPAIKVNQGLLHSRGKYIAYQFDDDQWPEKSLEVRIRILEQQEDLAVVYGKWEVYDTKKEREYLHEHEFSYGALIKDNYIANNAVAHHKEIINKYGMYDCHLAMRRLCDWDLWIRWGKQVPFIYIPEVVSRVEAMVENSLGNTVTYDIEASRVIFAQNRNELLTPQNIEEYSIDNLDYFNTELDKVSVYNKHMLTWELKHFGKSRYPLNGMNNVIDKNKERIIVTKLEYDATVNILVENYVQLFNSTYIYIPEQELKYSFLREGDILCLSRATSQNTLTIIQKIKNENRNISVLYFLDDDMLNVYKRGDKFNYLAPGTAMHNTVKELITSSDRVVAFSEGIANTVKQYNKKVTILKTNVLEKYLSKDDSYSEN
ncbi:MAG: glycosyltransferase family 2 protein, partial [Desulfitobacterium sp.]